MSEVLRRSVDASIAALEDARDLAQAAAFPEQALQLLAVDFLSWPPAGMFSGCCVQDFRRSYLLSFGATSRPDEVIYRRRRPTWSDSCAKEELARKGTEIGRAALHRDFPRTPSFLDSESATTIRAPVAGWLRRARRGFLSRTNRWITINRAEEMQLANAVEGLLQLRGTLW